MSFAYAVMDLNAANCCRVQYQLPIPTRIVPGFSDTPQSPFFRESPAVAMPFR
jgi:hypothetical protein